MMKSKWKKCKVYYIVSCMPTAPSFDQCYSCKLRPDQIVNLEVQPRENACLQMMQLQKKMFENHIQMSSMQLETMRMFNRHIHEKQQQPTHPPYAHMSYLPHSNLNHTTLHTQSLPTKSLPKSQTLNHIPAYTPYSVQTPRAPVMAPNVSSLPRHHPTTASIPDPSQRRQIQQQKWQHVPD